MSFAQRKVQRKAKSKVKVTRCHCFHDWLELLVKREWEREREGGGDRDTDRRWRLSGCYCKGINTVSITQYWLLRGGRHVSLKWSVMPVNHDVGLSCIQWRANNRQGRPPAVVANSMQGAGRQGEGRGLR